jgi:hypothetical protein
LLAEIMEEAAGYYVWRDRRPRLLRVILNFSYRLDQPCATFPTCEALRRHTRFIKQRLTEAVNDLVRCRVVQRRDLGNGALELTPLPDWWNWAVVPRDTECCDREYVASLVGYTVKETTARDGCATRTGWVVTRYPAQAADAVTQYARAYSRGAFATPALIPDETTLNAAVAEVARGEVAAVVATAADRVGTRDATPARRKPGPKPRGQEPSQRRAEEALTDVDVAEVVAFGRKLFPQWQGGGNLRDAYLARIAADRGPRLVFRALQRADDFGSGRIFAPINWLKGVLADMDPAGK